MLDRWRQYLRFWGPDIDGDVDDEIAYHLEQSIAHLTDAGMSPTEARRAALTAFGDVTAVRNALRTHDRRRLRRERGADMIHDILSDVRYGLRQLRLSPRFTLAVVLVLALGIGANTAVFSAIDAALLRPLPFPNAERLVTLSSIDLPNEMSGQFPKSVPSLADYQADAATFESMAAYATGALNLAGGESPARVTVTYVTSDFFSTLGARARVGRVPAANEYAPDGPGVVVLSHGLWQQQFGSDEHVIGRTVELNGKTYRVAGVMPASFRFPSSTDVWLPLGLPYSMDVFAAFRNFMPSVFVARLARGVSMEQATQHAVTLQNRFRSSKHKWTPETARDEGPLVEPLQQMLVGDRRAALLILGASAVLLLLIACANVANLLLTRASIRQREIAVRGMLGATRLRIVRQLTVETLILVLLGAAAALVVAFGALRILVTMLPATLTAVAPVEIDGRVLAFTFGVAMAVTFVLGIWPAVAASRTDLAAAMKAAGTAAGGSRRRTTALRGLLAVAELSLALTLLIGAGLMAESLRALLRTDAGVRIEHVVTGRLVFSGARYRGREQKAAFFDGVITRLKSMPGIAAAAAVSALPMENAGGIGLRVAPGEAPDDTTRQAFGAYLMATPGYFSTMGVALRGEDLPAFADSTRPVTVINETLAKQLWPNANAIGRQVALGPQRRTVIGIVADIRTKGLDEPAKGQMYLPMAEQPQSYASIVARGTASDPEMLARVRDAVRAVDPAEPMYALESMGDVVATTVAPRRTNTLLLIVFASLAAVLSAIGVYAVLSYGVAQRTREIGIRVALGAQRAEVVSLIVREGLTLVVAGVAIGTGLAVALARYLSSQLYEVNARDPRVYGLATLLLFVVAVAATMAPAARATRVDPIDALRQE